MRRGLWVRLAGLAVVAGIAVLWAARPAGAAPGGMTINCPSGCAIDLNGFYFDDYTVPSDGLTYEWDLRLVSSDPNATVFLDPPNETFAVFKSGGDTAYQFDANPFGYTFSEVVAPLFTRITVQAPADYDNCTPSTPVGALCAQAFNVFGNGTALHFDSQSNDLILFTSIRQVPEPATWAMLILGCGLVGAALRRGRAAAVGRTGGV